MPASEARIRANRINAARSTGPKTPEGKQHSRANGLKHGLTGQGIVISKEDVDEVEARNGALQAELAPKSSMGEILVRQLATLSVRMERGARQESAAIASRVGHAAEAFDEGRLERVEGLIENLADDPRWAVRQLRRMPEGVDRLSEEWSKLRDELARATWTARHLARLANLGGLGSDDLKESRLEAISRATWGNFQGLSADDGAGLDEPARRAWAVARMAERIDGAIAELAELRETLDVEAIGRDRAGAADVALFDPSRESTLARRYESEARRDFFKALKELRRVEADHTAVAEEPELAPAEASLGSSRVERVLTAREPRPAPAEASSKPIRAARPVLSDLEWALREAEGPIGVTAGRG